MKKPFIISTSVFFFFSLLSVVTFYDLKSQDLTKSRSCQDIMSDYLEYANDFYKEIEKMNENQQDYQNYSDFKIAVQNALNMERSQTFGDLSNTIKPLNDDIQKSYKNHSSDKKFEKNIGDLVSKANSDVEKLGETLIPEWKKGTSSTKSCKDVWGCNLGDPACTQPSGNDTTCADMLSLYSSTIEQYYGVLNTIKGELSSVKDVDLLNMLDVVLSHYNSPDFANFLNTVTPDYNSLLPFKDDAKYDLDRLTSQFDSLKTKFTKWGTQCEASYGCAVGSNTGSCTITTK